MYIIFSVSLAHLAPECTLSIPINTKKYLYIICISEFILFFVLFICNPVVGFVIKSDINYDNAMQLQQRIIDKNKKKIHKHRPYKLTKHNFICSHLSEMLWAKWVWYFALVLPFCCCCWNSNIKNTFEIYTWTAIDQFWINLTWFWQFLLLSISVKWWRNY
jgi:hypothetical protein